MKKFVTIWLAIAIGLVSFAGCDIHSDGTVSDGSDVSVDSETLPETDHEQGGDTTGDDPQEDPDDFHEEQAEPAVSPLAILDTIDVSAAFGDRSAADWSFALAAAGNLDASYGFILTSEISGEEKLNSEFGVGIGLDDLFGLRSEEESTLGVDLFGGGKASLLLDYRGPSEDSEPIHKNFDVGFRHDGDFIWYAGEGESEARISLSELKEEVGAAASIATFGRMEKAYAVIPEELMKGGRFALRWRNSSTSASR